MAISPPKLSGNARIMCAIEIGRRAGEGHGLYLLFIISAHIG